LVSDTAPGAAGRAEGWDGGGSATLGPWVQPCRSPGLLQRRAGSPGAEPRPRRAPKGLRALQTEKSSPGLRVRALPWSLGRSC